MSSIDEARAEYLESMRNYWIAKTEKDPDAIIDSIKYNHNGEYNFSTMGLEHGVESFDEDTRVLTTVDGRRYIFTSDNKLIQIE